MGNRVQMLQTVEMETSDRIVANLLRSDLKVPPYFGLDPIRSIISGMQEAKTAYEGKSAREIKSKMKRLVQVVCRLIDDDRLSWGRFVAQDVNCSCLNIYRLKWLSCVLVKSMKDESTCKVAH